MPVTRIKDAQRTKVYMAEDPSFYAQGGVFEEFSEFASFCKNLFVGLPPSFGNPKRPTVVIGTARAKTAGLAFPDYGIWKILLARNEPFYRMHATHEASHLLSHRWCELNGRDYEPHGEIFTSVNLYLVWRHVDKSIAIALRNSYRSHGVRVASFSDL